MRFFSTTKELQYPMLHFVLNVGYVACLLLWKHGSSGIDDSEGREHKKVPATTGTAVSDDDEDGWSERRRQTCRLMDGLSRM